MRVDVVIPTTRRSVNELVDSLRMGDLAPDNIWLVSNTVTPERPGVGVLRFSSTVQPVGVGDAGLRRNIGADVSEADIVVFLDDDLLASLTTVSAAAAIAERDGFCWGHHRYIDFHQYRASELLAMGPENGKSREFGVNRWHGWQSSYAGLLAIRRDVFWEAGGFDLAYLGHHGSEDQQLGRRLGKGNGYQTFVHEPPFAWHPTGPNRYVASPTGHEHDWDGREINGHRFNVCRRCPGRIPSDVGALTTSDTVVIPYNRDDFAISKEIT